MVKYLIIRFSSIGDIVLTSPVIRNLKNQVEGAEIHFLTKKQFSPLLYANPHINKIHILEGSVSELARKIKYEHFDYVIDLHNNIRTTIFKNVLKVYSFSVDKLNIRKWLMVNFKINRLPDKHVVDRYLDTLKLFDVKNDKMGLEYFFPEEEEINIRDLPDRFHKKYIGFGIGGNHFTKKLPVEKIISICTKTNFPIILLGGSEDRDTGDKIQSLTGPSVLNGCGKYTINQSASLVKRAELIISNDTGIMHIAAAFNKPIISLWGNTIPGFGMYPYMPEKNPSKTFIIEVEGLKCRPCSKIGYKKCPKRHFNCMNNIDEERIIEICESIIKK